MTESPAVRHKCAVTDSMERAALVAIGINPCPHPFKDEQVVFLHVVDDAAFDVRNAFGDEWGLEMHAEGYTLVGSWTDLEKSLIIPLFPTYSCPYRGLYFQRDHH